MPELPEVETVRRSLHQALRGRRIVDVERIAWERTIAAPPPETFRDLLRDRPILGVDRRAKYVLLRLDRDETLVVHLRMTGRLTVAPADQEPDAHTHVVLRLDDGRRLLFRDTRKFGRIWLLDVEGLAALESKLGPEPLDDALTAEEFRTLLRRRRGRLKPLLLDQSLIAGLGNIYVDEALWLSKLHPSRTAQSLSDAEVDSLYSAIRTVLSRAVENRGTTFSDFRDGQGYRGDNQHFLNVYNRAGLPCPRCGTLIERMVVGQRGTHICPFCQRLAADEKVA